MTERTGPNMYILCKQQTRINLTKVANSVGKSIYKRLDGGYSFVKTSTGCEVRSTILYQIPLELSNKYNLSYEQKTQVNVMDVLISITTYSNKLRVEVVELTPEEKTIGFQTFKDSTFTNVQEGVAVVMNFVQRVIRDEFKDYDVLF